MKELFEEFEYISKTKWIDKIKQDLKDKPYESLFKSYPHLLVEPVYTKEDTASADFLNGYYNSLYNDKMPVMGARYWENRSSIQVKDCISANKKALEGLNAGAEGLVFDCTHCSDIDLEILLKDIEPEYCSLSFELTPEQLTVFTSFLAYVKAKGYDRQKIAGGIICDTLDVYISGAPSHKLEKLEEIVTQNELPNFKTLAVKGCSFQDAGAFTQTELALSLSKWVNYLDFFTRQNIKASLVIENTAFYMSVGKKYFQEIAKFHAFRILIIKIASRYKVSIAPRDVVIHVQSSSWSKTLFDPYTNMLRNTTEAMSAILGGVQSINIAPYSILLGQNTPFGERISRNLSIMLKEESYLHKVADPVAGSYAIGQMIRQTMQTSYDRFMDVEDSGGFLSFFDSGEMMKHIYAEKSNQLEEVTQRKEVFVGTNMYANPMDKPDISRVSLFEENELPYLYPSHATVAFDNLRLRVEWYVAKEGKHKRPKALLISKAADAMSKARVNFAHSFLGSAGIAVTDELLIKTKDFEEMTNTEADIVVICATDEYYEKGCFADVSLMRKQLKTQSILLLAGAPSNMEQLKSAGINDFIHRKSNILIQLNQYLKSLNII